MCGRYSIYTPIDVIVEALGFDLIPIDLDPRYNAAPSQYLPVITNDRPHEIQFFRWGLIPFWAKDPSIGYKMINARSETALEKTSFKRPMYQRRCLVLSDGFYEWQKTAAGKVPHHIRLKGGGLLTFAGLWETWKDPEGKEINSFTVLTTTPNELVAPIHNRMPVIVDPIDRDRWLNTEVPPEALMEIMRAYPAEFMETQVVSSLVNSPRNDTAEILKPQQNNTLF